MKNITAIMIAILVFFLLGIGIGWNYKPNEQIEVITKIQTDTIFKLLEIPADTVLIEKIVPIKTIEYVDKIDTIPTDSDKTIKEYFDSLNINLPENKILNIEFTDLFITKPFTLNFNEQVRKYKIDFAYKFPENQVMDFKFIIPADTTKVIREINTKSIEVKKVLGNWQIAGLVSSHFVAIISTAIITNKIKE